MSNAFDAGLSPDEQKYFESGGQVEIPREATPKAPDPATTPETPAPQAKPEQQAEPQRAEDDGDEKAVTVPYDRLKAERERRKAVEERARETEIKLARLEERLQMLDRARQPEREPEPGIPDPDEDVFGATRGALKEIEALKQRIETQQRQSEQVRTVQETISTYRAQAEEYKAKAPDLMDAYEHLTKSRDAELRAMGVTDERQRQQMLEADELRLAYTAIQQGRNSAEILYEAAKARGYTPKPIVPPAQQEAKTEEAKQRSKSLSGVGGMPPGPMTRERLGNMSAKEFDAYFAKNPDKVMEILGGQ